MSKFKFSALISVICLVSTILYGWVGFSQPPQSTVRLTTEPNISQILPFEAEAATPLGSNQSQSPTTLMLSAVDAAGKPLENAKVHLQILTPPPNPLFPTDFPIVEGTELLDVEAIAPKGKLQVQQILPIRGKYQLVVNVTPLVADAFTPIGQTLTLPVSENPLKYRYFGILAAILLVVGLGGGLVIGGKQQTQPGEIAPARVRVLLSGATILAIATLLVVNFNAEFASADNHTHPHHHQSQIAIPAIRESEGLKLHLSADTHATVGQPLTGAVSVIDPKTDQPVTDVLLNVTTTQLEDNWVSFAYQSQPDNSGKLKWQQQFFDGAPHKIVIEVSPQPNAARQFQPFQVAQEIEVAPVAPPLGIRLIVLTYFTGIVVLGLVLGLWLRQSRWVWLPERRLG
jgi:hypothetical protein